MQSIGGASLLLGVVYFLAPPLLIGRGVFFLNVVVTGSCILLNRIVLERLWLVAPPLAVCHDQCLRNDDLRFSPSAIA